MEDCGWEPRRELAAGVRKSVAVCCVEHARAFEFELARPPLAACGAGTGPTRCLGAARGEKRCCASFVELERAPAPAEDCCAAADALLPFAEAEMPEAAPTLVPVPVPAADGVLACMRCSRSCTEAAASVVNRSVVTPNAEPEPVDAPVPVDAAPDAPVPVPVPDVPVAELAFAPPPRLEAAASRSIGGTAPHIANADR